MRPRLPWLLLALLAMALFITLGIWQWQRGQHKRVLGEQFAAGAATVQPLGSRNLADLPRFSQIELRGEYDPAHQFLLDNMIDRGRPGYQVLTPLRLVDGRVLLVNRGWLPFGGYRERLPDVAFTAPGVLQLRGRLDDLPTAGLAAGRAAPPLQGSWPRVTAYPRFAELTAALATTLGGQDLEPRVLLLNADQPFGYTRHWQPPGLSPQRHVAYAVQWWAFAALALFLLLFLNRRKNP